MQNSKTTIYKKAIAIDPIDLDYIRKIKKKKSAAGQLKEIINFYKYEKGKSPNGE